MRYAEMVNKSRSLWVDGSFRDTIVTLPGRAPGSLGLPESQRSYRYWGELRDRRDGSVRLMTLGAIKRIHPAPGKGEAQRPD